MAGPPFDFSMRVDGDEEVARRLEGAGKRAKDLRKPFRSIGKAIRSAAKGQFESAGARAGQGAWRSLSPQYAAWKRNKYAPSPYWC